MMPRFRMDFTALAALFMALTSVGQAQAPATDIFLARLKPASRELEVGPVLNITSRPGYDNQPTFTPDDDAVLFTRIGDDAQADIFRYDIAAKRISGIISTIESEYSPQVTPDGNSISVVRVEADSAQRLWRFPMSGGEPRLLFAAIKPVGYYAWADSSSVAMFVLGDPPELQLGEVESGRARVIARDVGRSIHRVPHRRAVSFVDKSGGADWWICVFDMDSEEVERLTRTLPSKEDYAWLPDGSLLMAMDSVIFRWSAGDDGWRAVASFSDPELANISRLAVSPRGDWLAMAAAKARRE